MRKLNLMALLVGAALFTGLGVTSAMAEMGGKCGAQQQSKCGDAMKEGVLCPDGTKCADKKGKCGDGQAVNPGKCGAEKKTPSPAKGKCG